MPIYEFSCDKCKKEFEVMTLSLSEKPNAVCPKCHSKKTRKLISKVSKGKYSALIGGGGGSVSTSSPSSSGCGSCSSTNCSSCGH